MSALGSLVVKLALEYAEYTKGLDKSSQESLKFAQETQKHFDKAKGATGEFFTGVVKGALAAGAAYLGVNAIISSLNESIDSLAKLDDMAQKTGSSVEELSRLQKVAEMTGTSFDLVDNSIDKLAKGMGDVDDKSNKTLRALDLLGVSSKDLSGKLRDPSTVMIEVAKRLQDYEDGAAKVTIANELFGKSGAELLPYMNDVSEHIDKFTGASGEAAKKAAEFQDKLGLMRTQIKGLSEQTAQDLLPFGLSVAEAFNGATKAMSEAYREEGKLEAAVVGLSAVGTFFFTDEFDSDTVKLKNLREELKKLETEQKLREQTYGVDGFMSRLLFGGYSSEGLAQQIKFIGYSIEQMQSKINTPAPVVPPKPVIDTNALATKAEADRKAQALADKAARTYEQQVKAREKFIEGLEKEAATMSMTTAQSKVYEATLLGIKGRQLDLVKSKLANIDAQKKLNEEEKRWIEIGDKSQEEYKKSIQSMYNNLDSLEEQVKAQREYNDNLGLSNEALVNLSIAKLEDVAAGKERNAQMLEDIGMDTQQIEILRSQAKELRELANLKRNGVDKQEGLDQLNVSLKDQVDMWKSIDDTAHDTFISIANGAKNLAERSKESLKNIFFEWLYQMTIKKWIINISAGATFAGSGAATAQGLGGGGLGSAVSAISTGKSLWEGFSAAGSLSGGLASATAFASGLTGIGAAGANSIAAASFAAKSAALSSGLTGSAVTSAGTAAGAASAGGMGASISSAMGAIPVWGWALLGAAAIASFSGGKDRVIGAQSVSGTLGTNDINRNVDWTKDGGWFHANTKGTWNYNLANSTAIASNGKSYQDTPNVANDQKLLAQLNSSYDAIKMASAGYATALGINADVITSRVDKMSFVLGKTQEEIDKSIKEMFGGIADDMARSLIPSISEMRKEGETASATLGRIATGFGTANAIFADLHLNLFSLNEQGYKASATFVELMGGVDALKNVSQSYFDTYFSQEEKNQKILSTLTAEFEKQKLPMQDSIAGFRALVEEVSKTGTPEQLASLLSMNQAFASIVTTSEKATAAANALADSLAMQTAIAQERAGLQAELDNLILSDEEKMKRKRDALFEGNTDIFDQIRAEEARLALLEKSKIAEQERVDSLNKALEAEKEALDAQYQAAKAIQDIWQNATNSMVDEINQIRGTIGEKQDNSFASAQTRFAMMTAKARAGDVEAYKLLPSLAKSINDLLKNESSSTLDYALAKARLAQSLEDTLREAQINRGGGLDVSGLTASQNYAPQNIVMQPTFDPVPASSYEVVRNNNAQNNDELIRVLKTEIGELKKVVSSLLTATGDGNRDRETIKVVLKDVTRGSGTVNVKGVTTP